MIGDTLSSRSADTLSLLRQDQTSPAKADTDSLQLVDLHACLLYTSGIARMCLLQNKKDSALVYYQQALDCALVEQDSSLIGALYHDLAMAYSEKKDYIQADKYVSKAIMIQGQDAVNVCLSKAQIMLNLNKLDSASYFYRCV